LREPTTEDCANPPPKIARIRQPPELTACTARWRDECTNPCRSASSKLADMYRPRLPFHQAEKPNLGSGQHGTESASPLVGSAVSNRGGSPFPGDQVTGVALESQRRGSRRRGTW